MGEQRLADTQLLEVATERMHVGFDHVAAAHVLAGDRREHARRALHGGALQVVLDRTQATQLFTTTGAARATVLELRQRRAVPSGLLGSLAIEHQQSAMPGSSHRDSLGGHAAVGGDQGRHQAAFATGSQCQGFVEVVIGHQRTDRAERFDIVGAALGMWVAGLQQGWRKERAFSHAFATRGKAIAGAEQLITSLQQAAHPLADIALLVMGGQGPHAHTFQGRVANHDLAQAFAQAGGDGIQVPGRDDRTADGGALLPGFSGHFTHHFLDVQVKLFAVRSHVRAEDGAVERVGLGGERH